jgi:hypothetical protein
MLFKYSKRSALLIFRYLTLLFWTLHICLLAYFVTEFKPADIFLFQYQLSEVIHTISSSGLNWLLWIPLLLFPGFLILISRNLRKSMRVPSKFFIAIFLTAAPGYAYLKNKEAGNPLIENKSTYFYASAIRYFAGNKESYGNQSAEAYQHEFPGLDYVSSEYPFLHKIAEENGLDEYFTKSDTAPNIVILIVEGLGNQFVDSSNGVHFMLFLDSLKQ